MWNVYCDKFNSKKKKNKIIMSEFYHTKIIILRFYYTENLENQKWNYRNARLCVQQSAPIDQHVRHRPYPLLILQRVHKRETNTYLDNKRKSKRKNSILELNIY